MAKDNSTKPTVHPNPTVQPKPLVQPNSGNSSIQTHGAGQGGSIRKK